MANCLSFVIVPEIFTSLHLRHRHSYKGKKTGLAVLRAKSELYEICQAWWCKGESELQGISRVWQQLKKKELHHENFLKRQENQKVVGIQIENMQESC